MSPEWPHFLIYQFLCYNISSVPCSKSWEGSKASNKVKPASISWAFLFVFFLMRSSPTFKLLKLEEERRCMCMCILVLYGEINRRMNLKYSKRWQHFVPHWFLYNQSSRSCFQHHHHHTSTCHVSPTLFSLGALKLMHKSLNRDLSSF